MKRLAIFALIVPIAAACASARRGPMAMATISPTSGSTVGGTVHFQEMADGSVEVRVDLTGVPPGTHGFHVHENGQCGNDGSAAGSHFNPLSMPHGAPSDASHHAGDFGNVTADANREVHTTITTRSIRVSPGTTSVLGRALILHARADDLTSQPSGDAGDPIACGVIQPMAGSMHR